MDKEVRTEEVISMVGKKSSISYKAQESCARLSAFGKDGKKTEAEKKEN